MKAALTEGQRPAERDLGQREKAREESAGPGEISPMWLDYNNNLKLVQAALARAASGGVSAQQQQELRRTANNLRAAMGQFPPVVQGAQPLNSSLENKPAQAPSAEATPAGTKVGTSSVRGRASRRSSMAPQLQNPQPNRQPLPEWPLKWAARKLAWGHPDNLVASSIPLTMDQVGKPMAGSHYYEALAERVAWMLEQADEPEAAVAELARNLDDRGAWDGPWKFKSSREAAQAMLVDNPAFPDLFQCTVPLPDRETPMTQMPVAVRTIQEITFWDWIDQAFSSPTDGSFLA